MKNLLSRFDFSYVYAFLSEATLALTFILYIFLARILGPEQYGIFASATALAGILSFFIQFGLPYLLAREVSAHPQEGSKSTVKFLVLELINSVPVFLLLFPIASGLGFEGTGIVVCYFVVGAEVCRSAKLTVRAVLRGLGKFNSETISVSIERLCTTLITGAVLFLFKDIVLVIITIVLVRLIDILGLVYYLSRQTPIWSKINFGSLWRSLKQSYPFALAGVLLIIYYQIDLVMIKALAPVAESGFYSAAFRTLEIFAALPRVIFAVTFTKFARCYAREPERIPAQIYQSISILMLVVLPTIVVAGFGQNLIVEIIYGQDFLPAIKVVGILIPSLSMQMFGGYFVKYFLQAIEREKMLPPIVLITVIINIICNAILIPLMGAMGAAIATLVSEILLATFGLIAIARIGYDKIGKRLLVIAYSGLLVAVIPSLILHGLNLGLGLGLMMLGIVTIATMMRRSHFLSQG